MYKSYTNENNEYGSSVNYQPKIKYQKKIPKNSKFFIKTKSQDKIKKDNSSNKFKSIMKQMHSEILKNNKLKDDKEDNDNDNDNIINFISPRKRLFYNSMHKNERNITRKKLFQNNSQKYQFEKIKDRLSIKRVKLNKEKKDEIFSPFFDQNKKLMDRFTQISIIRPNKNDIFLEPNSDSDIVNDEFVYFYGPNKDLRLDLGNSSKREIKNIFENNFPENKLIIWDEINFSIDRQINDDKKKINFRDLIEKGEKYDKLIIEYKSLLKKLNELKIKNIISSKNIRGDEKKIQHLEDVIIYNNINKKDTTKRKKPKIKKVKKKRMTSLTPNIRYISSSEETKTRDNSKNAFYTSSNELIKKKYVPNIMIISKENEFNLDGSYTKLITSDIPDNIIINKPKKKVKKFIKKNIKENNWNKSNTIIDIISFNYIGNRNNTSINNIKKNKTEKKTFKIVKKKIIKKKEKSREKNRTRTKSNGSYRKIKKINLPVINIKNETFSYNIKKKYFRFKIETKSVDFILDKNKHNTNQKKINTTQLNPNHKLSHNHSKSMSIDKKKRYKDFDDDIIIKNINLNIINQFNNNEPKINFENENIYDNNNNIKEYNDYKIQNILIEKKGNGENISEKKEFSCSSYTLKDNSDYLKEDEKHKKGNNKVDNYNDKNSKRPNIDNKDKKYTFRIKVVKYNTQKKKDNIYFDILFKNLINKILIKRTLKKWLKLSKK